MSLLDTLENDPRVIKIQLGKPAGIRLTSGRLLCYDDWDEAPVAAKSTLQKGDILVCLNSQLVYHMPANDVLRLIQTSDEDRSTLWNNYYFFRGSRSEMEQCMESITRAATVTPPSSKRKATDEGDGPDTKRAARDTSEVQEMDEETGASQQGSSRHEANKQEDRVERGEATSASLQNDLPVNQGHVQRGEGTSASLQNDLPVNQGQQEESDEDDEILEVYYPTNTSWNLLDEICSIEKKVYGNACLYGSPANLVGRLVDIEKQFNLAPQGQELRPRVSRVDFFLSNKVGRKISMIRKALVWDSDEDTEGRLGFRMPEIGCGVKVFLEHMEHALGIMVPNGATFCQRFDTIANRLGLKKNLDWE